MKNVAHPLLAVTVALAGIAPPLHAHPFWIQPQRFGVDAGGTLPYTFEVGHGAERSRSAIPSRRILRLGSLDPLGRLQDLRPALDRGAAQDGQHRFDVPGLHVLYLVTDAGAVSVLPAGRFNAYLHEEGLLPALAHRQKAGSMGRAGAERYRRVAKTLVQAGPPGAGGQDGAGTKLGLPLEIVLGRSPALRPRPTRLPLHVLYAGKPLAGGLVKLTRIGVDAAPVEMQRTDAAGNALFGMPPSGQWRLDVVWTRHAPAGDVDYDTLFSSLAFVVD